MRHQFLRVVAGNGGGYDHDAQSYITAVEAADMQALEVGVKDAYNDFVVGCKADGIWAAIQACCIMAGARTLDGALVPLVGAAPTSINFVGGDYNRVTGLTGNSDGSANGDGVKYVDSGMPYSTIAHNNGHAYVNLTTLMPTPATAASALYADAGSTINIGRDKAGNPVTFVIHDSGSSVPRISGNAVGGCGVSRMVSTSFVRMINGTSGTVNRNSTGAPPGAGHVTIFARNGGFYGTSAPIRVYTFGTWLDLALLDARVTTLITDIAAAI